MFGLELRNPLRALAIASLIARGSDDPRVLEILGAGPLEDLLSGNPALLDTVAQEAKSNPNFRAALRSIWQSTIPDDVWAAVQRVAAE
jgi:hypothetical protein